MSERPGAAVAEPVAAVFGPTLPADLVPQHLVLVLPTTGEFDSRTYRIATTCLARGHTVTVLSRHKGDLPWREDHPAGFTIIRVLATAEDGMPLRRLVRAGRVLVRRLESIVTRRPYVPPSVPRAVAMAPPPPPGTSAVGAPAATKGVMDSPAETKSRVPVYVRGWMGIYRRLAIPLQIRSHRKNARTVAPRGDLVHGMAFMGIPVALTVAQRDGVLLDALGDLHLERGDIAGEHLERDPQPGHRLVVPHSEVRSLQLLLSLLGQGMETGPEQGPHLLGGHHVAGVQAVDTGQPRTHHHPPPGISPRSV